jgi:hypothetical protein
MSHAGHTARKAAAKLRARASWMFETTIAEMEWVELHTSRQPMPDGLRWPNSARRSSPSS